MSLPEDFVKSVNNILGEHTAGVVCNALDAEPNVSVRLNKAKCDRFGLSCAERDTLVPWADDAYYMQSRLTFTFDPLFHAGCYYVQEPSSMFVARVAKKYVSGCSRVLDLCAAPGGKTTLLRSVLSDDTLLVANEPNRMRANVLAENCIKWGHGNVAVTNNMPADFRRTGLLFDAVFADVPCSGEGMFRKDIDSRSEWSLANVVACQARQREIISDIWNCLKPGGILVYSTCTMNTSENEENIKWIMDEYSAEPLTVDTEEEWGIAGNMLSGCDFPVYRFLPGFARGEGFFLCVLRKPADSSDANENTLYMSENRAAAKKKKNKQYSKQSDTSSRDAKVRMELLGNKASNDDILKYVKSPADYVLAGKRDRKDVAYYALPLLFANDMICMQNTLNVLVSGINITEARPGKTVFSHQLAMSADLDMSLLETCEITYQEALMYLQGQSISLRENVANGMVLLTFKGCPLGFVNNVGSRANNLYPREWRIKTSHLPENPVSLFEI